MMTYWHNFSMWTNEIICLFNFFILKRFQFHRKIGNKSSFYKFFLSEVLWEYKPLKILWVLSISFTLFYDTNSDCSHLELSRWIFFFMHNKKTWNSTNITFGRKYKFYKMFWKSKYFELWLNPVIRSKGMQAIKAHIYVTHFIHSFALYFIVIAAT